MWPLITGVLIGAGLGVVAGGSVFRKRPPGRRALLAMGLIVLAGLSGVTLIGGGVVPAPSGQFLGASVVVSTQHIGGVTVAGGIVTIPGEVIGILNASRLIGPVPESLNVALNLVFKFRPGTDPDTYVSALYNKSSSNYHHFLDPSSFADMFAPSPDQYRSVITWLGSQGLTVTGTYPDRLMVNIQATAGRVESAFGVSLSLYRFGNVTFYANSANPQMPANLGNMIKAITGLHNFTLVHPLIAKPLQNPGDFAPVDIRTAYDATNLITLGYDGTGQTIDILDEQADPTIQADLNSFDTKFGLPAYNGLTVLQATSGTLPNCDANTWCSETTLDVEWAHAMAPGAAIHLVEVAGGLDLVTGIGFVVNNDLPKGGIFSNSWGMPEDINIAGFSVSIDVDPAYVNGVDSLLEQAATQGISTFFSSGDTGAFAGVDSSSHKFTDPVTVQFPASDPWVTAVGGTTLSSTAGPVETAWNSICAGQNPCATGGGISCIFSEPYYQFDAGIISHDPRLFTCQPPGPWGSRAVPDVSMDADPSTGVTIVCTFNTCQSRLSDGTPGMVIGGTSLAAPLWAGAAALLNQASGENHLGFMNPMIYSRINDFAFHDITVGGNGFFNAGAGYDMATGWGTPDLFRMAQSLGMAEVSVTPSQVFQGQGSVSYTGHGFTPGGTVQLAIWNDGNSLPEGNTMANSGQISGSFPVGSNIFPGQRRITFTDVSSGLVLTAFVNVIVCAPPPTVSVEPTELGDVYQLPSCPVDPRGNQVPRALLTSFSATPNPWALFPNQKSPLGSGSVIYVHALPGQLFQFSVGFQIWGGTDPTELDALMLIVSTTPTWPPQFGQPYYLMIYCDHPSAYPGSPPTGNVASFSYSAPLTPGTYYVWFVFDKAPNDGRCSEAGRQSILNDFHTPLTTPAHFAIIVPSTAQPSLTVSGPVPPSPPNTGAVLWSGTTVPSVPLAVQVSSNGIPLQGAQVSIYGGSPSPPTQGGLPHYATPLCSGLSDSSGVFNCTYRPTAGTQTAWYASATKTGYLQGVSPGWTFSFVRVASASSSITVNLTRSNATPAPVCISISACLPLPLCPVSSLVTAIVTVSYPPDSIPSVPIAGPGGKVLYVPIQSAIIASYIAILDCHSIGVPLKFSNLAGFTTYSASTTYIVTVGIPGAFSQSFLVTVPPDQTVSFLLPGPAFLS